MVNPQGVVTGCGASIIHNEWGITAAHCTALRVTIIIRAGAVSLTRPQTIFETTEYYNHPSFQDAFPTIVQPHDIALLKFGRFLEFTDLVKPVRLQRHDDRNLNYNGVRMVASGWGRTWTNGAAPENLNWVYLVGDSNILCVLVYGGSSIIQDSTICASAYNVTSQSTCQGDSGGPLTVLEADGIVTQVGIASFVSSSGCHTAYPAGFIRPGHYHDWYYLVTGIDFDKYTPPEPITTPAPTTPAPTTPAPTTPAPTTPAPTTPEESEESEEGSGSDEYLLWTGMRL